MAKHLLDENGKEIPTYLRTDIIGKKFGNVTVLKFDSIKDKRSYWKCQCDCGQICYISRKKLNLDNATRCSISCGCIPRKSVIGKDPRPLSEKILAKYNSLIEKRKINRTCWEYTGYIRDKIPMCSWLNKVMSVRKCMYLLTNFLEDIDRPIYCSCGNLKCFNPDHLTFDSPKRGSRAA